MLIGKSREKSTEIPTASLSDIVFLLLVFFLVTTSIDTEKGLDLVLPPPGDSELEMSKKNLTNILVNAEGQVLMDNEIVEIGDIARIVKEKILSNPLMVISLKTDKETQYRDYIRVLDQLKKAEAKKISIAEPEE
jgi:biopolymer transport protein ExbD